MNQLICITCPACDGHGTTWEKTWRETHPKCERCHGTGMIHLPVSAVPDATLLTDADVERIARRVVALRDEGAPVA